MTLFQVVIALFDVIKKFKYWMFSTHDYLFFVLTFRKCQATNFAFEWLISRMKSFVGPERRISRKRAVTYITMKWLFRLILTVLLATWNWKYNQDFSFPQRASSTKLEVDLWRIQKLGMSLWTFSFFSIYIPEMKITNIQNYKMK